MTTTYRIMAVDDNEDTLNVIRMTLEESYFVLTIKDPMDCYEMIKLFEPDLIILDIMMPKVTGFQILEILQHRDDFKQIPVIILSAREQAREIRHGYRLGAKLYITKPFTAERLKRNIDLQFQKESITERNRTLTVEEVINKIQYIRSFQKDKIVLTGPGVNAKEIITQKLKSAVEKVRQIQEDTNKREPWVD